MPLIKKRMAWEFWPVWILYIPIYILYLWHSLRSRSFFYFSAANPSMVLGGMLGYSKWDILKRFPQHYLPATIYLHAGTNADQVLHACEKKGIAFPFILKPDKGERGMAVEKIRDHKALHEYLEKYGTNQDLLLQEYIDFPEEYGVMYWRFPGASKGIVDSVVKKGFLRVTGDGKSTLRELIMTHERASRYQQSLFEQYAGELDHVLPDQQTKKLVEIGNHSRGTTFYNANHLINAALVEQFDALTKEVDGFYFGRFDIRVKRKDDLYTGHHMKLMEVNGANSEPAHIYDPGTNLFDAYKHLFYHWRNLYQISRENHRKGLKYMTFLKGSRKLRQYFKRKKKFFKD